MTPLQSPVEALRHLWLAAGGEPAALDAAALEGAEPALPSSFAVSTAAQASIAAAALAAREIGRLRGGPAQQVRVDMRHAAAEFRSERYLRVNGEPPPDPWDRIAGLYRCADGWVRLHTNFAHHRDGMLQLLGCEYDKAAVARALLGWQAEALETAAAEEGLCASALRSFEQWDAHPQAKAVAASPVFTVDRLDDAAPQPLPALPEGALPLQGLRVLDLTRVIAGPVAGRTLAAYGADVMQVTGPHLPTIASLNPDTGRGKRSAQLDLREPAGREALQALVRQCDVFLQGYRPGALAALGFGPQALARMRPGVVVASLSAYGPDEPWAPRHGYDSLVQAATGFNLAEAEAAGASEPKALPCQALDHASGYLLALGIQAALMRRSREGGSWHVQVSLVQTAHWLRGLGRVSHGFAAPDPQLDDVRELMERSASPYGELLAVRHAGRLSATSPRWDRPAVPLGTHAPAWDS